MICALLLLNAAVGFVQEFQAGSIVEELKKTLALKAVVLRDGQLKEVEAPQVVPGDILQVEEVSLPGCGIVCCQPETKSHFLGYNYSRRWPHRYRGCVSPG